MEPGKKLEVPLALRIALAAAFLVLLVLASIRVAPVFARLLGRPEEVGRFVASYGSVGALVYIVLQVVQVVVFVIPGEIVQVAGGYVFGTWLGALLSVAGILAGTAVAFFAARVLGYGLVQALVSPKKLQKFEFLISDPKAEIVLFVLFLVPGIPKDSLVYISGLTPVRPLRFFMISMIARLPGIWGAAYIGAHLQRRDFLPVWILSGIALVLFIAGVLLRDRLIDRLHSLRRGGTDKPDGPRA